MKHRSVCRFAVGLAGFVLLAQTQWCDAGAPRLDTSESHFRRGTNAYEAGEYEDSAEAFRKSAGLRPASGTLLNLGNAEWQRGRVGHAVLAWEQAMWPDPFNVKAKNNLKFARKAAQLESPEMAWYEVVSSWLPGDWWAWITGLSLWSAVGLTLVPGILRLAKSPWHQAIAAMGLAVFLLSLPAQMGVNSRTRLGYVLKRATPLRLTPTEESQLITTLGPGEPARVERATNKYVLVKTSRTRGWIHQNEFGTILSFP